MKIKQFFDDGLAQASYAVISEGEMAVIDPARNPEPYYTYAKEHGAEIRAVIETHSHADFISSHLEIHEDTGADIYCSRKTKAEYPHKGFDDEDTLPLGRVSLKAVNTPGHSPDSISILLIDEDGREYAVFSGDTLFVGDVGRPDLREEGGEIDMQREQLARKLYGATRNFFMKLDPETMLYPGHGAGSLCGKNMADERSSTIGRELEQNELLQEMDEAEFVEQVLRDQPFIPKYFKYAVKLNKRGAPPYHESLLKVPRLTADEKLDMGVLVIDARQQNKFKNTHIQGAVNLMNGPKFETWLGSIVAPDEPFYLITDEEDELDVLIAKTAKIGYEGNIKGAMVSKTPGECRSRYINLEHFKANPAAYTIIDIRNSGELLEGKLFDHARHIPLHELRERAADIQTDKPMVVHCGAGYRSAAGFSILEKEFPKAQVYDLSTAVQEFLP
jgi:hydroxyacylglutathione hydrolase